MRDKIGKRLIIVLIGFLLWIIYLCGQEMSRYGIYTIFNFNMCEILAMIPFLFPLITVCWLVSIIANGIKKKEIKFNLMFGMLLTILLMAQVTYIWNQNQMVNTSCIASIESINEEKKEIVINANGTDILLTYPILVEDFLKSGETEYFMTYEWSKTNPNQGKMLTIQDTK